MGSISRRFFLGVVSLTCLNSLGCLYFPYALPDVSHVPTVQVPWPSDDVHVFRVDGTAKRFQQSGIGCGAPYRADEILELTRLQPSERKSISKQWTCGVEKGWAVVGLANQRCTWTDHSVGVRFYRVGYGMIHVGPGEQLRELEWKAVADLAGQEKAVDDLIGHTGRDSWRAGSITPAPGTQSPAHREALLFCAKEYDRIAWFVTSTEPDADEMRSRLKKKSNCLMELAGGTK